jgi:acyl-CoA hydrolase
MGQRYKLELVKFQTPCWRQWKNHKDIGIHTEMFSDGILPLVEKGVITGKYKRKYKGKIVGTFAIGSRKLYDFMHDNPIVCHARMLLRE